jgi:hypothetical protein
MNKLSICFIDCEGRIILEQKLTSLPLREEVIRSKSIEFFNDPEPCMIHRTAVMKRLYMEIYNSLCDSLQNKNKEQLFKHLPEHIKSYICVPNNTMTIIIKNV